MCVLQAWISELSAVAIAEKYIKKHATQDLYCFTDANRIWYPEMCLCDTDVVSHQLMYYQHHNRRKQNHRFPEYQNTSLKLISSTWVRPSGKIIQE